MQWRIVDHGVSHGHAPLIGARHVVDLRPAVVYAEGEVQPVVQHPRLRQGTCGESVHVCRLDDALTVHIVEADVVVRLVVSSTHREVMVVADARSLHLFLPVGVGSLVIGQLEVVVLGVAA